MDCSTPAFPVHHQVPELIQIHVHWVGDAIRPSHPFQSIIKSRSLFRFMFIESVMPSNHLILCHPLFLLPSIFPSIRVFSNESALHIRRPKDWSFSFSICPSNEYLGLISFRMDWLDLLAVHGTVKNLLQHHSSKASVFWRSAFFIVQLSHPYMTTGKIIALTLWTLFGKVMSLSLSLFLFSPFLWRRKLQPTSVFLPEKSHGWRSLASYSPWGLKDQTRLSDFTSLQYS